MHRRRWPGSLASFVAAALVAASLAAGARPARAQDADEPDSDGDSFWSEVAHPHRARYGELISQGTAFLQAGDPTAATALLEQAVKLDAGEPMGFYLLGVARDKAKRYAGCADALAVVERLRPGYVPAGARVDTRPVGGVLGLCFLRAGRFDEAAAHYRRMLGSGEAGLSGDTIHNNLGDCYQALGRLDEAIDEYSLAAAAAPKNPTPLFGLAVALDRDEQVARAHEAMARALALDPQLAALSSSSNIVFVPPEDAHYYFGLAFQAASSADPLRRAPAIVRFRRYLAVAGQSPWAKRVKAHLAELGASTLGAGDVLVGPVDAPEHEVAVRATVAAGPDLQKCMENDRDSAVRAAVRFYPVPTKGAPRPAPRGLLRPLALGAEAERVTTLALDGEPVSRQTIECIERTLRGLKLTVRQLTLVQVAVIARSP